MVNRRADKLRSGDVVVIPKFGRVVVRAINRDRASVTKFVGYLVPKGGGQPVGMRFEADNPASFVFFGNADPDPVSQWVVRER